MCVQFVFCFFASIGNRDRTKNVLAIEICENKKAWNAVQSFLNLSCSVISHSLFLFSPSPSLLYLPQQLSCLSSNTRTERYLNALQNSATNNKYVSFSTERERERVKSHHTYVYSLILASATAIYLSSFSYVNLSLSRLSHLSLSQFEVRTSLEDFL